MNQGPEQRSSVRKLRPWFLVIAMLTVWVAGVLGVTSGCGTVMYLREGTMPDEVAALDTAKSSPQPVQALQQYAVVAQLRAVAVCKPVTMPVSIARVLLSMTLVAASAMVLAGRRGALSFSLQALAANTLFALIAYGVTAEVRDLWISSVVQASGQLDLPAEEGIYFRSPAFWYWFTRGELIVLQVGVLLAAAFAVSLPRSRLYLAAMAELERLREDE